MGESVWRVGRTAEDILGEGCEGQDGGKCLESGTNSHGDIGRRMWRTGWGKVSGEWDEQQKISWEKDVKDRMGESVWRVGRTATETLGEGCGGLDGGKCLESGTNSRRYLGRRMWRTGWGKVSGEWDEQPRRHWEKDVEDWMGERFWRVGRTATETLGEGCGGLDGSKCLESGTNSRRLRDRCSIKAATSGKGKAKLKKIILTHFRRLIKSGVAILRLQVFATTSTYSCISLQRQVIYELKRYEIHINIMIILKGKQTVERQTEIIFDTKWLVLRALSKLRVLIVAVQVVGCGPWDRITVSF